MKGIVTGILLTLLLTSMLTLAFNIQSVKTESNSTIGFYGISYEIYYDSLVSYLKTLGYTVFAVDELNFTYADVVYIDYRVSYPLTEEELLDYVEDGGSLWVYGEAIGGTFLGVTISTDSIWFDGALSDPSVWVREHPLLKDVKSIVYPDGAWIEIAGNFEEIVSIDEKVILAVNYSECGKILWLPDSDIFGDYFFDDGDNSILARNIAAWLTTRTWIVDDDGPADFSTIQEAINAANPGDTILVSAGIYHEYVYVNKSLDVIGEGATTTVWNDGDVFEIHADNVTISGLRIDCAIGFSVGLFDSHGCNISYNIMHGGFSTIYLYKSSSNVVAYNDVFPKTNGLGVQLYDNSDNNIIRANNVTMAKEGVGIHILGCANNKVEHNKVKENYNGILIHIHSNNNVIHSNIVENNFQGITLFEGEGNRIYHNNLINNPGEVMDTGENIWDNGAEGNYWDDYNGTDLDGDGIGDTYLPWESVDNYPLMNVYWNPADVNHDLKVDIYDVVLICVAYGSTPSDPNWNCHCDIAEPYGIINIYDIVLMCVNYGEEYNP